MFTQVYFHPIRVAYDNHVAETLRTLLPGGEFPEPKATGLDQYLAMDDWWALGQIRANKGGPHGEILSTRAHYWKAYSTPEVPGQEDIDLLGKVQKALGGLLKYVGRASGSWYKLDVNKQIPVLPDHGTSTNTLSDFSTIVRGIRPSDQRILFVDRNDKQEAKQIVSEEVN